eukprot:scaffold11517_cov21-Tisochrysis_lutea.AAC.3
MLDHVQELGCCAWLTWRFDPRQHIPAWMFKVPAVHEVCKEVARCLCCPFSSSLCGEKVSCLRFLSSSPLPLMPPAGPASNLGASAAVGQPRSASTSRTTASSPPQHAWSGCHIRLSHCWKAHRCACARAYDDDDVDGGFTVEPGRAVTYSVRFSPGEDNGAYNHELRVRVANNPYEDYRIALSGEGFQVKAAPGAVSALLKKWKL